MSLTGLTPQSYLLGTLMSAATLKVGEFFASQDNSWRGHVVVMGILGIGGVLATPLSRGFSKWTGTVLTPAQALLIFGVVATFKAVGIACRRFLFLKDVPTYQEARNFYTIQLRPLHLHFSAEPKKFQSLDLHTQTVLNKRFAEQKFEPIAFESFSDIGTDYTHEELVYLASEIKLSKLPSQEDRQKVVLLLYENNLPPLTPEARADYNLIPIVDLTKEDVAKLSKEKIQWIQMALHNARPAPRNPEVIGALAQAFFDAKLPPPLCDTRFFLNLDNHPHPSSYKPIPKDEIYLISWLKHYYPHRTDKWLSLPLQTQMDLNRAFGTSYVLSPRESDFSWIDSLIPRFYKLYEEKPELWYTLHSKVQAKFNEAFKAASLEPIRSLKTLSHETFSELLQLFIKLPTLFNHISEAQQKEICLRASGVTQREHPRAVVSDPSNGNISYHMPNGDLWIHEKSGKLYCRRAGETQFQNVKRAQGFLTAHRKYECVSGDIIYETQLLHVEPFSKTMNSIVEEKSAHTLKSALWAMGGFCTLLITTAVGCSLHIMINEERNPFTHTH